MYSVQQQTTTQNHITIFGMIIMEFKMEKNEQRYATVKMMLMTFLSGWLIIEGCWRQKRPYLSPTSQTLSHQHILSPKSVIKIDVTVKLFCSIWQVLGSTVRD